jgi:tRNA threonylcarbamoyladenosine biosynthesis protein TsaB
MNALRILGLDTSGKVASAAILDTEQDLLLAERSLYTTRGHSQIMMPMVQDILTECGMTPADVDCYAVAVGPGSYTGLRIGIAAVQGMAMVNNTPCIGVSTLEAMAARIFDAKNILAVMHARADLFYCAWFSYQIYMHYDPKYLDRATPDEIQTAAQIAETVDKMSDGIVVTGDGAAEFIRQYEAMGHEGQTILRPAPPFLRLQSASGVCYQAAQYIAEHDTLPSASDLTASYLQAVNITRKGS